MKKLNATNATIIQKINSNMKKSDFPSLALSPSIHLSLPFVFVYNSTLLFLFQLKHSHSSKLFCFSPKKKPIKNRQYHMIFSHVPHIIFPLILISICLYGSSHIQKYILSCLYSSSAHFTLPLRQKSLRSSRLLYSRPKLLLHLPKK